jgi:hypothetical protein
MRFHRPDILVALVLLCAGVVVAASAALAQGASPHAFLESIYKTYRTSNAKGVDTARPDVIRRHFAPTLARAIIRDAADARKRDDLPRLNGDPFIDAQDWQIADLRISMQMATRRNASGVVTFTNAGAPRTVLIDLVKTGDGWRVFEIKAPSGSLRELYNVN